MKFAKILTYKVYILIFIVLFRSLRDIYQNKIDEGFNRFTKFCILPFLLYAGIRHLLFSQKNFKSHPYYELQVGGANIGVFIGLLLGIILNIGIPALACILLIYDILVISKSLVHFKYSGINEGLKFIPFILIISYFVYLGFKIRG